MNMLFEFLETLDELVYISDIQTYDVIYMNKKLRDSLGGAFHKEYMEEKCYRVLQGYSSPCPFCTNSLLRKGKIVSWTHKNPVLDKRYLVKDSMLMYEGRQCRIEMAIDVDTEVENTKSYYYARSESILNECLQQVFSTTSPEEAIERVITYLGKTFLCDRAYVFEQEGNIVNNTYEWCAPGVSRQKNILQNLSASIFSDWDKKFKEGKMVNIWDLEEIRDKDPYLYATLKPQNISKMIAAPLAYNHDIIGFVGVDNPDENMFSLIQSTLKVIGYSIVALLKRRDLIKHLNKLSFHDALTEAYNRNALFEHGSRLENAKTAGVIYCDISGLKQRNDTLGHSAGDQMIRDTYELLKNALNTEWIYRTGGDEFVVVMVNVSQSEFSEKISQLRIMIQQGKHHIAIGYAWSDQAPFSLESLISQADKVMYQDKKEYYNSNYRIQDRNQRECLRLNEIDPEKRDNVFYQFLENTYCDMEMVFQSFTRHNSTGYLFFGDMQKDLFYISDNMRDGFGFESNVVPGLLREWSQRIATDKARELYWHEINSVLEEKRNVYDLRYQVRDINGKVIWVRCYGMIKWNADLSLPLFFTGRITYQNNEFVVDPVTNFPREFVMFRRLDQIIKNRQMVYVIGFSYNHIGEINNTRGRTYSDHLMRNIAESLVEKLSDKMSFYRLEGIRYVAIVEPSCQDSEQELVQQIQDIISKCYQVMGISVRKPCSLALMRYPQNFVSPTDFLEQMVSLIKISKRNGTNQIVEYAENGIQQVKRMSNMALELSRDVLAGMKHFRLVIQPVISVEDGSILGGETLLRWKFQGEDISPEIFIPILERENMIHQVGRWVFEETVSTCLGIISHYPDFYLTYNVSLHQMSDVKLTKFMKEILVKYQLDGSHLVAEMTESFMDEQPEKLLKFVEMCDDMGIRIALDDFGSGYSSLRMLLQYPSNIIKLDRSLLEEMMESDDKKNFISSIVYACHRFGKKVCMEGVETPEQDSMIKDSGCDMIQGYYYYKPMEVSEIYRLLVEKRKAAIDQ